MFPYRRLYRRTVIANLKTGKAFRGVLWRKAGPVLVLRNAELLDANRATPVDGEVVIERSNIDFLQVLEQVVS